MRKCAIGCWSAGQAHYMIGALSVEVEALVSEMVRLEFSMQARKEAATVAKYSG